MKRLNILFLQIVVLSFFVSSDAWSAPSQESFKITKFYFDDIINDDGTENSKNTISMTVLREDAVKNLKQYTINYSTSAEKVEVLEAYTTKADGRRIDAEKNNFQLNVNSGRKDAPPAFSDQSSLTVVFPDVVVGDTVTVVYNKMITDPLFPKQFSTLWSFTKDVIYDDARISYSIPLSLNAKYKNYALTETMNKQENGRQLLTWTFKNLEVKKTKYIAPPVREIGDEPGVALSTFPSYVAIAEAYGARANPKAKVTDQIQALANDITKGKITPQEQAKALYDWEIDNITYAGNCIGIGSIVPRDLDFVLKNKMGDCKDHATLLQALLSAKGIESTQALIGVNNIYKLPDIPLVEIINHVINYIPSLNLYADATSGMPFGYLDRKISGKPVLLVDGYKDGTTTPKFPAGSTQVKVDAKMAITEDGAADGITTIATTTPEGASHSFQQQIRNLTPKKLEEANEDALKHSGYQGTVTMNAGTWDEKTMTYTIDIHYHLQDYAHIGTPSATNVEPPFSPQAIGISISYVMQGLAQKDSDKLMHGSQCSNGLIEENYQYVFPKNMNILAIPNDVSTSTSVQAYTSKYALSGQTLNVSRKLNDTTPGPTCGSEIEDEYKQLAIKVWPDLKAQIVYK